MPKTWIEINEEALRNNARALQNQLGEDTMMMGVVKANAYGHGIENVVPVLDEYATWFGVDSLDEAHAVRVASNKPILILNSLTPDDAKQTVTSEFHQMVSTIEQVQALSDVATELGSTARVHIKFDTGMSRQGVTDGDSAALLIALQESKNIEVAGLATHFSNADMQDDGTTAKQSRIFTTLVSELVQRGIAPKALVHAANSSAMLLYEDTHHDLVRPGIALYGIWPSSYVEKEASINIEPVFSLKSSISQIKRIPAGSGVGYGLADRVTRETTVAVLPIGYADGYDRRFSRAAHVLVRGVRAKVLGNISMNLTTVDVTDIPNVQVTDTATIIGVDGSEAIRVEDLAKIAETIPYEIVSRFSRALPRYSV